MIDYDIACQCKPVLCCHPRTTEHHVPQVELVEFAVTRSNSDGAGSEEEWEMTFDPDYPAASIKKSLGVRESISSSRSAQTFSLVRPRNGAPELTAKTVQMFNEDCTPMDDFFNIRTSGFEDDTGADDPIPTKNDSLEELAGIAEWIHGNLGADSPWHVTKFFPAYQLSHLPATENAIIDQAAAAGRAAGLTRVYGHTDISCDCASENAPVSAWLELDPEALAGVNKCAASCCGDDGILVKKFEREAGLLG